MNNTYKIFFLVMVIYLIGIIVGIGCGMSIEKDKQFVKYTPKTEITEEYIEKIVNS